MKNRSFVLAIPLFLLTNALLAATVCAEKSALMLAESRHMGTLVRIMADCDNQGSFEKATQAAFDRIEQIEQVCSDYRGDSEVLKLSSKSPTSRPITVSDDLWHVMQAAQSVNQKSGGAFDVTVGPLSKAWRRFRRRGEIDHAAIEELRKTVGQKNVVLDSATQSISLTAADMRVDLGGIAKGYAVDQALAVLKQHGITRALVDAGGDIGVSDPPRDSTGWPIAIAGLDPKLPPILVVRLRNAAVATSGDAFQYLEIDGKRYSHILDPRTGYGVEHRGVVTLFAETAMQADAWASAISVLGNEEARSVDFPSQKIAVWSQFIDEDQSQTWASPNLGSWLAEHSGGNDPAPPTN